MQFAGKPILLCLILFIPAMAICFLGRTQSPNINEVGHLPAGCLILRHGNFELYEVNPPLVKMVAAIPVVAAGANYDWSDFSNQPGIRRELLVGRKFVDANGADVFLMFTVARWILLPFWVLGAVVVNHWATAVYGRQAGYAAAIMFGFSPEIMAWTATVCPDSVTASMGVLCVWRFRIWLRDSRISSALAVGISLGLAVLAKSSLLILIPPFVILGTLHRRRHYSGLAAHSLLIFVCTLYVVNAGYGFSCTLKSLGDFSFFSKALTGPAIDGEIRERHPAQAGNRFAGTWLHHVPVPLPRSFMEGLDLQKYDFEVGKWSYLRGEHKFGGWWYWYIYALLVKTPVGTILLFCITCGWAVWKVQWRKEVRAFFDQSCALVRRKQTADSGKPDVASQASQPMLRENLILLAPAVCLFVLVSSQPGFSRYLRYVLPCYPFVFIWMSQIFSEQAGLPAWLRKVCWGLLAWSVISSLSVFPHSMSYFNELAGGPENGPAHLIDASIDWGQDVLFLADWVKDHPEASRLYLSLYVSFDPLVAGIEYEPPPIDPRYATAVNSHAGAVIGPRAGWYAVSVHMLHSRTRQFAYLLDFEKADMIGYSIYIYHITEQQAADWNNQHGFTDRQ